MRPELDETTKRELRGNWIMRCLEKLSPSICRESGFAVGNDFSVADIFVASIYKKALQHGCTRSGFYDKHLMYIRAHDRVVVSEPQA